MRVSCDAAAASSGVHLVDLSLTGARLESRRRFLIGSEPLLSFTWRHQVVEIAARVERCRLSRVDGSAPVYDIGVSFHDATEGIAEIIAAEVGEMLHQQKANAAGVLSADGRSFGAQLAARGENVSDGKFIQLTLEGGRWRRASVSSPAQPRNGFTVSAAENGDQIALLQRTFERGDDNARALICRLASMTISVAAASDARSGTAA